MARGQTRGMARRQPGTVRRILRYSKPYRWPLILLLIASVIHAAVLAASPLILRIVIDDGILQRRIDIVLWLCAAVAGLALLDSVALYTQGWCSGRVGEGLVYDLRADVFAHVQRQSLSFFTHAQTGSLVSRLNTDVIDARQGLTNLLAQSVSSAFTLIMVFTAMFFLNWQIAAAALVMIPFFLLPARLMSRRLGRIIREMMQLNADMSSMMNERFNVFGALLVKLYGRPAGESALFASKASRVRDVVATRVVYGRMLFIILTVLTGFTLALVYGVGGSLVINGKLQVGTLVAIAALLMLAYAPINQLSALPTTVTTALVSFERVFEVLDLPLPEQERADIRTQSAGLPAGIDRGAPDIEFDRVRFRYPDVHEVPLASLETTSTRRPHQVGNGWALQAVSFRAPGGKLTALVGPSGAGKTTITHLIPRLFDPTEGTVRIGGDDLRDLPLQVVRDAVGVVTQDPHLFHDTLRANLEFACPGAAGKEIEEELIEACRAAQIWDRIFALPDGLDTVVGDRGYRLSGGEKQRLALARLLLKSPPVVVLDEATAHLDSESEAAVQRALRTALANRTSIVIAHRLSTVRQADQIMVLEAGVIHERGTHHELLAADGLYADLYHTQFAQQSSTPSA
jgi:ATP-binding cassette, subfamily B, bacterial